MKHFSDCTLATRATESMETWKCSESRLRGRASWTRRDLVSSTDKALINRSRSGLSGPGHRSPSPRTLAR